MNTLPHGLVPKKYETDFELAVAAAKSILDEAAPEASILLTYIQREPNGSLNVRNITYARPLSMFITLHELIGLLAEHLQKNCPAGLKSRVDPLCEILLAIRGQLALCREAFNNIPNLPE